MNGSLQYVTETGGIYDVGKGIDIGVPLIVDEEGGRAFGIPYGTSKELIGVRDDKETGLKKQCNCKQYDGIVFHCHCTHTETIAHILKDSLAYPVNKIPGITDMHIANLVSIHPTEIFNESKNSNDQIITKELLIQALDSIPSDVIAEAIVIRTAPDDVSLYNKNRNEKNPTYFTHDALAFLATTDYKHLLIDLPSVDREDSDAKTPAHRAYWNYNGKEVTSETRVDATITELINIPETLSDGTYMLNLGTTSIKGVDAVPSRPMLYSLDKRK